MKKLTIALPCYNLEKTLSMSIDSILNQRNSDEIEILIIDNQSSDSSWIVAQSYQDKYDNIRCIQNEINIGPDRNFLKCLECAESQYVLLLGDDILMDGVLDKIIECIDNNPDFIFLNYSSLIQVNPIKTAKPYVDFNGKTGAYKPANIDEFFEKVGARMTFLSSLVFKKERFDAIPKCVRESYINTFFLQTHLAMLTLKDSNNIIIIRDNCIAAGVNLGCGYDFYNVWFEQYHKLLFDTAEKIGVSREVSERLWKNQNATIRAIFFFRWKTKASKNWDKRCVRKNLKGYPWIKFKAMFAVYFPRFLLPLVMCVRAVYRKFKRGKAQ